jgi:hypothetical protein
MIVIVIREDRKKIKVKEILKKIVKEGKDENQEKQDVIKDVQIENNKI